MLRTPTRANHTKVNVVPRILMLSVFLGIGAVLGVGSLSVAPASEPKLLSMPAVGAPEADAVMALRHELLALVNAERMKIGVAPLTADHRLHVSAQLKADDMLHHNYFGHTNPHNGKYGPRYVMEAGMGCRSAGEIILDSSGPFRSIRTAERAVSTWMRSTHHRDTILNARYLYTGFGVSGPYIVEHFCLA